MDPYFVYTQNRPLRIAYLAHPQQPISDLDKIFTYNYKLWGGRWNIIVDTDGTTLAGEAWEVLDKYDPDIIATCIDLNEILAASINCRLCPLSIQKLDLSRDHIALEYTPAKVSLRLWQDYFSKQFFYNKYICNFEFQQNTPIDIQEFSIRNFGVFAEILPWRAEGHHYHEALHIHHERFSVGESFRRELEHIPSNGFPASRLCSIPFNAPKPIWSSGEECFEIVVGETALDLIYFWNRPFTLPYNPILNIDRLIIPQSWMSESSRIEATIAFLRRHVRSRICVVSCSVDLQFLSELTRQMALGGLDMAAPLTVASARLPKFREQTTSFSDISSVCDVHRVYHEKEVIANQEPSYLESGSQDQYYIVDSYIVKNATELVAIQGKTFWWQLPRSRNVVNEIPLFDRPWRVNRSNSFSLILHKSANPKAPENTFHLSLPSVYNLFWSLLSPDHDRRAMLGVEHPSIHLGKSSDVGRRLAGVVSLFENLDFAAQVFESRYWRRMFRLLSARSTLGSEEAHIKESVQKYAASRDKQQNNSERTEFLTALVMTTLRKFSKDANDLLMKDFEELARKEMLEWNERNPTNCFDFDRGRLVRDVDYLLERNILLLGIRPLCIHCGFSKWIPADSISNNISCSGCGQSFSLGPEEPWRYRLNSMICSKGHELEPLLLVLKSLLSESRRSFFYIPSAELLSQTKVWHEIDVICLIDGKLILGEVKGSYKEFTRQDFVAMREVAKAVQPDGIVFTALYDQPTENLKKRVEELAIELKEMQISVGIHALRIDPDEPTPIFGRFR